MDARVTAAAAGMIDVGGDLTGEPDGIRRDAHYRPGHLG